MRNLGLVIFALISLVVHVTAAVVFFSQPDGAKEERGIGNVALEIGSAFDAAEHEEVQAQELEETKNSPEELEPTQVANAIPVKTFVQEVVEPTPPEQIEPEPAKIVQAKAVAEPLLQDLVANETLAKPEIFKPREIKPVEIKRLIPKKKEIKQVKATKPKPVKQVKKKVVKPKKKKKKQRKAKKSNVRKKAQQASKASRKGGEHASKRGRKGATGGSGGKSRKANGAALFSNYKGKVRGKVLRKKRGLGRRDKGVATIRFRVSPNGRMSGLTLARSSGKARIDREALAMARRAAPFPPFPVGMSKSPKTFVIPIQFKPGR